MGLEAPSHWVILLIAAALLFGGYKKLPEMSRSIGRSLRIFKTEMKGMTDDDAARDAAEASKSQPDQQAVPPVVPAASTNPQVPPAVPPAPAVEPTAAVSNSAASNSASLPNASAAPAAEASRETPQQQAQS